MARITLGAIVLCFSLVISLAQQDPLASFPLRVGTHRTYDYEWKSGNHDHPHIDRWTTEESVTGSLQIPEGLVLFREIRLLQGSTRGGYLSARDHDPYLAHNNCVYVLSGGWDAPQQQLLPEYRQYLDAGSLSPDFCFPLNPGRTWGNSDIPWQVFPDRDHQAIHLLSTHFGSGGREDVWFRNGVGVVRVHYLHLGTYDEYTKTLR